MRHTGSCVNDVVSVVVVCDAMADVSVLTHLVTPSFLVAGVDVIALFVF